MTAPAPDLSAILPCPECGQPVGFSEYSYMPQIACRDCYDGAPYDYATPSRSLVANETTKVRAIESWNEQVEERLAEKETT